MGRGVYLCHCRLVTSIETNITSFESCGFLWSWRSLSYLWDTISVFFYIGWRIWCMQQDSFLVSPSLGGVLRLTYEDRKHTVEQPFFRPSTYALSKSLPFSLIGVHYDYFKGYNFLSVGGELEKLWFNHVGSHKNVHCGGMAGWNKKRQDAGLEKSILDPLSWNLLFSWRTNAFATSGRFSFSVSNLWCLWGCLPVLLSLSFKTAESKW